jgi:hypothetical protein
MRFPPIAPGVRLRAGRVRAEALPDAVAALTCLATEVATARRVNHAGASIAAD